ncbi:MAG: M42 family metallopeptidase [Oligoflexia bacterium]|nr:M42 family metallopeptidase [Oligoflexia bacterium]
MKKEKLKGLLRELTALPGIPSYEKEVREYILCALKETGAEVEVNSMGCVIAVFKGKNADKGAVLLDAHMDEVGFIVQYIEDNGFIRVLNYGGIDPRSALGQRYEVHSDSGKKYGGVIGLLPPHVAGKSDSGTVPIDQMFLDCGFSNPAQIKEAGIRIGSQITFMSLFSEMENGLFSSKAIDDRAGCAVLLGIAAELDKNRAERTVILSFSVQEEGGTYGIPTVIRKNTPEYALVIEATTACDTPGNSGPRVVARIGGGPAFTVSDKTVYISPEITEKQIRIAGQNKIRYQFKTPGFGGTNAGKIQNASTGIKTGIAALPARYLHSSLSVASWDDLYALYDFAFAFINNI